MVAQTTIAPVDRMKILLQAQNEHYKHLSKSAEFKSPSRDVYESEHSQKLPTMRKYLNVPGLYRGFKKIARFEGVRAYFRGNGTQMLRIFPSRAIIFGVNDGLKRSLPTSLGLGPHATSLVAGSVAGTVAITVTFPLDMVMARLAYHTPGSRRYAGIWDAAQKIFAEVGSSGHVKKGRFLG